MNGSAAAVEISQIDLTGDSFSVVGPSKFPVTIAAGGTYSLNVQFNPVTEGDATGQLTITDDSTSNHTASISLQGKGSASGTAVLSSLSCSSASMTGSGTDACTVTLNRAAPSAGLTVSISSNNAAVTVPATVAMPANATSAGFAATVSSVSSDQAVTLTATAGTVSKGFTLNLNAATGSNSGGATLSLSTSSVAFGNVQVGTAAAQSVTLSSTGIAPVTINSAILTGAGFSLSGATFPTTLNPGQKTTLTVQFDAIVTGVAAAQLSISSNSSTGAAAVITLSGTGTAVPVALSGISCSSGSMIGSGTDACTVTLTSAAPSSGLSISLSSSNAAVTVPARVMVPANIASVAFTATVTSVGTAQSVTLTANSGSVTKSFALQLNAMIPTLTINATSIPFGRVEVSSAATQSVTLTSTGTAPVTVISAALSGTGFSLSGASFPVTLSTGQAVTLNVQFEPATLGAALGQMTVSSNSSINATTVIGLSGTGTAAVQVSVTPITVSTTVETTKQFTATVTGTSNKTLTWAVSGNGCSGAACGTISSGGSYTAPPTVPSPDTVIITATSELDPNKSASATATIVQNPGTTYYLATTSDGGQDSNDGLSSSKPWLTPNHSMNCGDVILAAPSTAYNSANFGPGKWGSVSCPSENNVAWLKCAIFDACKISTTHGYGMSVTNSFWGVQGWEITVSSASTWGTCFDAAPLSAAPKEIHHIIFANNIANGCQASGLASSNRNATASVDYLAIVGNIAYNAAQSNTNCYSGISVFAPIESDSLPGTHIYVAGNFSFGNIDPNPCFGGTPSDGNGIIFDSFDGSQSNFPYPYRGQAVADNNMLLANGGRGLLVYSNSAAVAPYSSINLRQNTIWGNNSDLNQNNSACGELVLNVAASAQVFLNLAVTDAEYGCGGYPIYAFYAANRATTTNIVYQNWGYSASGTNVATVNSKGFTYGPNNTFDVDPDFADPIAPDAPSCGNYANVPACMAQVIANFTPRNRAAKGYGYQIPSSTQTYDPLFPRWLCNVNLPAGLVSMGCKAKP